jgi:predicted unusual protein kinase regulating ubiquinone biosynthesis (AarF/ABC1/UbiB family)
MSDFLKKFKSIFVVEEAGGDKPAESPTEASGPVARPARQAGAPPVSAGVSAPAAAGPGSVTEKFMEILLTALEKNNQPGFDYLEFRQSLKNLAKMSMDEPTRFQSAYAMAQTMGVTPEKLVESARYYMEILHTEQSKFNEAHAQQRGRLIGNREEEVKNLEAAVQQKAEQIKQLQQQIEEHRQRSEQIRKEINESTVKIETTKADFDATFTSVVGQISEDVTKIQQYIK